MDFDDINEFLKFHKRILHNDKTRLGMVVDESPDTYLENFPKKPSDEVHEQQQHADEYQQIFTANSNFVDRERESARSLEISTDCNVLIHPDQATINPSDEEINANKTETQGAHSITTPAMLRYGDYSPNLPLNCYYAQPHLGFGDYELQRRRTPRLISKIPYCTPTHLETNTAEADPFGPATIESCVMHNNRSPVLHRLEQRISAAHGNRLLKAEMEKPRGILLNRNQTPRERLLSDLKHSYLPSGGTLFNGYSDCYTDRSDDMERDRIKREIYHNELRLQIEEKQRLATMREEQERREQELENKRLEQQLLRMQEEQLRDEQRRNRRDMIRRNSDDYSGRKQDVHAHSRFRKYSESDTMASKLSHYSPPVSRRAITSTSYSGGSAPSGGSAMYPPTRYDRYVRKNALNRLDSINSYVDAAGGNLTNSSTSTSSSWPHYPSSVSRYDSLSRIDSLKQADALSARLDALTLNDSVSRIQRRHSATQQDLTMMMTSRRSPKLQRRSSSGRYEEALPMPLLKAHSPVARELKYSHAVNSTSRYSSSDALRKLDDRWQHLGVIRRQLQRKQSEMDAVMAKKRLESVLDAQRTPMTPPKAVPNPFFAHS